MDAERVVSLAKSRGLTLELDGDRIRLKGPQSAKTDALIEVIRKHKDGLVELLQRKRRLPATYWRRIRDDGDVRGWSIVKTIPEVDWNEYMRWVWPNDNTRWKQQPFHQIWANAERIVLTDGSSPVEMEIVTGS